MYSFIVGAGLDPLRARANSTVRKLLENAARHVIAELPDLGGLLRSEVTDLPEINGGWVTIQPERGSTAALISEWVDAQHACLVFGQIDTPEEPAKAARDAFVAEGPEGTTDLAGIFSALIVERRERRMHVLTSVPGCRALHYEIDGSTLILSPLDAGIVALSRSEVAFDNASLATMVACGWPLGGATALKGVRECQPHERLIWEPPGLCVRDHNPLTGRRRVDDRDTTNISKKVDEVIDELRAGVRRRLDCYRDSPILVPLTAGIDSRAVLSLFCSVVEDRTRLRTYTRGESGQDVRVARRLARHFDLPHETRSIQPSISATFLSNAKFAALATNGIANADTAIGPPVSTPSSPPAPVGSGGEVFRGFYYNYMRRQLYHLPGPQRVISALASSPLARVHTLRFADHSLCAAPMQRLEEAIHALEKLSTDPFDLADLFYIFERLGRWGSSIWRRSLSQSFAPFLNGRAMAAAFQLPSPIGSHAIVSTIIARYAPRRAFWTPVNGAELLALDGNGVLRYSARELLRGTAKVVRRSRQRLIKAERTPAQARRDYLTAALSEPINDVLRASNSIARTLFDRTQFSDLLDSQDLTPKRKELTGALFSLELWKLALLRVAAHR